MGSPTLQPAGPRRGKPGPARSAFSRPGAASPAAGAARPGAHPFGPLPSGPAAPSGPEPGPSAPSPPLPRSSPAWEPRPGPRGAEQLEAHGGLPREEKGDEPSPGARADRLPLCGAPTRVGAQGPLTRWLSRPRGCVSGSPAAPGRASQIPTANAGRQWASGTGEGERERGPCSGTCQSVLESTHRTRDRGTHVSVTPVYLLNRLGGTRRASQTVFPALLPDTQSVLAVVPPCLRISLSDHPKKSLIIPFPTAFRFFSESLPFSAPKD
ncbi:uncharacterized protein LOC115301060 [Suricata suricatta]|uniref:uncharacterized protein LOC115301060 n=1 Tax=Suricata suricatta TaxID=37032 RepID=UPI0011554E73|nr:uncharacterized protein LOC115301060 [Suricata suricatta]